MSRRLLLAERGYSLIEMLVVLVIMGVVMTSLTTVFVQASNSETDMNNRFQAQLTAKLALDKVRREVHCATVVTPTGVSSSVTITLPSYCKTGSGSITWCTRSNGTNRYALYRVVGSTCTGGVLWADYLVPTSTATVSGGALQLHGPVDLVAGQAARGLPGQRQAVQDGRAL